MNKQLKSLSILCLISSVIAIADEAQPERNFSYDTKVINTRWVQVAVNACQLRKDATSLILDSLNNDCRASNVSCGLCGIVKSVQEDIQQNALEEKLKHPEVIEKGEVLYEDLEKVMPLLLALLLEGTKSNFETGVKSAVGSVMRKHFPDVKLNEDMKSFCKDNDTLSEKEYKDSFYSIVYAFNKYLAGINEGILEISEAISDIADEPDKVNNEKGQ